MMAMQPDEQLERFAQLVDTGLERGMTRREFIRRGLALGLSLPSISGIIAACGGRPLSTAAAPHALPTAAVLSRFQPSPMPGPSATPIPPTVTPVPPTPTPPARFGLIGDFGLAGEPAEAVSALVKGWQPDFIISLGDNNYPAGELATIDANVGQYYHAFIGNYQGKYGEGAASNRFFPCLGNHDWMMRGAKPYLDYFRPPNNGRYYTFTQGLVQFFVLDSTPGAPDGTRSNSKQAQWLREELNASVARWRVVYMHHPPYSSGWNSSSPWMRWPFRDWGADVVISGHDHDYERLILDGFPYIVNGLGGGARYVPRKRLPGSEAYYNANHGAILADATEDQIAFQFITRNGEVVDYYELERT